MNPSSHRIAAFATALALFTMASSQAADDGYVRGSGRVQTETRVVTGFQAIDLRGSVDLVLRQGAREGVELKGDDNVLPLVETRVADHRGVPTLEIDLRRGTSYTTRNPVVATVDLKTLSALAMAGSGDVSGESLKTPALQISLSGSGDLRLKALETGDLGGRIAGSGDMRFSGRAARSAFQIRGSGDIDAAELEGDDVTIGIAGSGDASVIARKTLTVSIAGSGNVTYRGDPAVKKAIAGSGTVSRR